MFRFWSKTPATITTHPASSDDLSDCADIHAKCFSNNWEAHDLQSMLTNRNTKCIVANSSKSNSRAVGFLMYRVSAGEAEILTIAVDPEFQNQGIGITLLDAMIRWCLIDRLEEIFLEVDDSNLSALKIYKRRGFKKVGERKGYYDEGEPTKGDALIMRLDLSE